MAQGIQPAPPPAPGPPPGTAPAAAGPAAPPKGPAGPAAPTLHGTKAAGSGSHQNGGATKGRAEGARFADDDDGDSGLFRDYALLGANGGTYNETSTIHAAISHWLGESEPVRLSPAQLSEFKKLFDRNHTERAQGPADRNAYIPNDLSEAAWMTLNDGGDMSESFLAEYGDEMQMILLDAAVKMPYVELPPDCAPQSANEEALFIRYITDPRAGFAPEGVAAFITSRQQGIDLERSDNPAYDFVDAQTGEGWQVAPVRSQTARPLAELQNAVSIAQRAGSHLLFDATHVQKLEGPIAGAINEFSKNARSKRITVALGPTQLHAAAVAA